VTVCAAFPLAVMGAETTTRGVGMADNVSLRSPWYFFTLDLKETPFGLLIEHSHRLFGWAVGMCAIVLAIGLQLGARGWHRRLGWVALLMVTAQGIFGILRVKWNALAGPELAAFHGCFAQLTIATLVAVAVLCTREKSVLRSENSYSRAAILCCVIIFTQIIFGAIVRHRLDSFAQRFHILLAFGVVGSVHWLAVRLREGDRPSRRVSRILAGLVLFQVVLGIEAWIRRFGAGVLPELVTPTMGLAFIRSAHHLLGTVIFSMAVALATLQYRSEPSFSRSSQMSADALEGAA
jgi:cytochrome c oxidase assembly protein subunit 15